MGFAGRGWPFSSGVEVCGGETGDVAKRKAIRMRVRRRMEKRRARRM
jgi:hypothetical protein